MKHILLTRLLHWKKQWPSLLFWLLFPVIAAFLFAAAANEMQSEITVPVGVVVEDDTPSAHELYEKIAQAPFLRVHKTTKADALHLLEKHELDSVFIILEGYEKKIRSGSRNGLLTSYESNRSFAYTPVKEMILSFVQEETGRAKAAYTVQQLSKQSAGKEIWTMEEITESSKRIQSEESLLETDFSYAPVENQAEKNSQPLVNVWEWWAIFTVLSTLLLSDWVIKEKKARMHIRLAFSRYSFKNYLLRNAFLYTALFFIFDLIAIGLFTLFLKEHVVVPAVMSMLSFRLMIQCGGFLAAQMFKHLYRFYSASFAIASIFAIISGAILPVHPFSSRHRWLEWLHPIHSVEAWLFAAILLMWIWYVRKEKSIA